jgi:tetratricopeptide (TPR) repeat protein
MRSWIAIVCISCLTAYGLVQTGKMTHAQEVKRPITVDQARKLFKSGDYSQCIEIAKEQVQQNVWNEQWPYLLIECYLMTGQYVPAQAAYEEALKRFGESLRIRMLGVQVYRMNDLPAKAATQLQVIAMLTERSSIRYSGLSDLVPLGEYLLSTGRDPKQILKLCFDPATKQTSTALDAHLATTRMALDKNDAKVASQSLSKALKIDENDPEVYYLLARTWRTTDGEKANGYLQQCLKLNAKHVAALLMVVEDKMDEEQYSVAETILKEVEGINSHLPKLWALRAAIAHLEGRYTQEGEYREKALVPWRLNPEVDFTIGKHLAMHYRFAESAEYQRRSLRMDSNYLPAKTQLAQDLLRLGQTEEGWSLVEQVRAADPYDVTIFNLKQLEKELDQFAILEAPGLVIRMDARESRIYGEDVVQLLSDARKTLTEKYQVQLEEPIYVEIFPKQKDFAIRTFGLPGGQGFLGVCFGRLITANSPAALQVASNWKSVLWHEYCHVVTLQKTKNKMPRWLSEGISVYEERLKNPTWGQSIDPTYREMILGADFFPLSKLSSAFLHPKTPMHLQFAYFEASLAVEFFIQKYGLPAMIRLLNDLATGMPASDALRRAPGSLEALDQEFEEFAKARANGMAPNADWSIPPKPTDIADPNSEDPSGGFGLGAGEGPRVASEWYEKNPKAYRSIERVLHQSVARKEWEKALPLARELLRQWPDDGRANGSLAMLAMIHKQLNQTEEERDVLVRLVNLSSDSFDGLERLCEIDEAAGRSDDLAEWTDRLHAIQPIRFDLQQRRALASEKREQYAVSVSAWRACLDLDPLDVAWIHFRIASAYEKLEDRNLAKRYVLMALEESPRFTEALQLLVRLQDKTDSATAEAENEKR